MAELKQSNRNYRSRQGYYNRGRSFHFRTDQYNFSRAHQLLTAGQLDDARIYLEGLLRQYPDNLDFLYNLGLCYVDLGLLDQGGELLGSFLEIAPRQSHACVTLAHRSPETRCP